MKPVILASKLSKCYSAGSGLVRALNNISISINSGEFLMITGKNGSGKSTLLHQLALLDQPTSGEVEIDGQKTTHLNEIKRSQMRLSQLGYIFQEYALIAEMTALENVMLPSMMTNSSQNAKVQALEILEKVGLKDKTNRLPAELSGGEQQKVAIARSLINQPKILFADEPTANLDTAASKSILEIFQKLNQEGITIIMVTHETEELVYASRLIKLSDGRLV